MANLFLVKQSRSISANLPIRVGACYIIRMRDKLRVYSSGEIAQRLGRSSEWFYDNKARLYARGLPKPLPTPGHPRWSADLVDQWLLGWLGPVQSAANDTTPPVPETDRNLKEWREDLARRYRRA